MTYVLNKKVFLRFILIISIMITLLFPNTMSYATESLDPSGQSESNQHVFDKANLLSTSEKKELEQLCIDKGSDAGVEIILLTDDDPNSDNPETYVEDFEDQLPEGDRVYTYIDMANRKVIMEGYGITESYLDSSRITEITDEMVPYIQDENYYEAFSLSLDKIVEFMEREPDNYPDDNDGYTPPNYDDSNYNDNPSYESRNSGEQILTNVWVQLLIALIIGGTVVGIMAYNAGGRMTTGNNTYMDPSHSGLIGRRDDYLHTHVTRVRKPQNDNNNSSGGFGGGGVSSGGRSHSTGGSSF